MAGMAVLIVEAEIAKTHELEGRGVLPLAVLHGVKLLCFLHERGFDLAASQHVERIRVQAGEEILGGIGLRIGEEVVILAHLSLDAVFFVDPMDRRALDLAAIGGIAAAGVRIVSRVDFHDISILVLFAAGARR